MKICSKCQQQKPEIKFERSSRTKSGFTSRCLDCKSAAGKQYYAQNLDTVTERIRQYQKQNAQHLFQARRIYKERHRSAIQKKDAAYYAAHKEELKRQRKQHFLSNPDAARQCRKARHQKYMKLPEFRMKRNIRTRIWESLNGKHKTDKTLQLTGCSVPELIKHLESKFTEGMSWDNYGRNGWHIDHIKPCISFDLSNPEEQRRCFHYTNLQPLWEFDNLSKNDQLNWQKPS